MNRDAGTTVKISKALKRRGLREQDRKNILELNDGR